MRAVYLVGNEERQKAEDALKKDEEVSRGSITVRSAGSLDIDEDGYFIIIDCPEETIKKADGLLKGTAKRYEPEKVLKKLDEQEDSAVEGFGNILG